MNPKRWIILPTLCLVVLALWGCASVGDDDSTYDKVITKDTELYQTGSADSVSERRLEAGARVRTLGMSGEGRLEVQLVSGEKGYVDSSAVGDAPYDNPRDTNRN